MENMSNYVQRENGRQVQLLPLPPPPGAQNVLIRHLPNICENGKYLSVACYCSVLMYCKCKMYQLITVFTLRTFASCASNTLQYIYDSCNGNRIPMSNNNKFNGISSTSQVHRGARDRIIITYTITMRWHYYLLLPPGIL